MTADAASGRTADWRLAVDIGGTFTDLVLLDVSTGTVVVDKTLTTPSSPLASSALVPSSIPKGATQSAVIGGSIPGTAGTALSMPT